MSNGAAAATLSSTALEQQIARLQSLLALLQQERQALQAGERERERLGSLSRDKVPLLASLAELLGLMRKGLTMAASSRSTLQQLLNECLRLNDANGALLETQAARSRQRLHRLKGTPAHYDGRGRERFALSGSVSGQA